MDTYQLAAGVALGVIMAGSFGWCVYRIAAKERFGSTPEWTHVAGALVILLIIIAALLSG